MQIRYVCSAKDIQVKHLHCFFGNLIKPFSIDYITTFLSGIFLLSNQATASNWKILNYITLPIFANSTGICRGLANVFCILIKECRTRLLENNKNVFTTFFLPLSVFVQQCQLWIFKQKICFWLWLMINKGSNK